MSFRRWSSKLIKGQSSSSNIGNEEELEGPIRIKHKNRIQSLAVPFDCKHVVGSDSDRKIRRWRVEDGREVGSPIDASFDCAVAVSQDGRWIVAQREDWVVAVWSAEGHEQVAEFKGHGDSVVEAVDVSPDGTRVVTGTTVNVTCVWSRSTGERLLGPWIHQEWVIGVKFSPDGRLVAILYANSVRAYDVESGHLLFYAPIYTTSSQFNRSFAWTSDNKRLLVLSDDQHVHCLDASNGSTLENWVIHSGNPFGIALARNDTFITTSVGSTVSFWDTRSHKRFGPVIRHPDTVNHLHISANYDIVIGGGNQVTIRNLRDILPTRYCDTGLEDLQDQDAADGKEYSSDEIIESLRAHLRVQEANSSERIASLEKAVQELDAQLADSQRKANNLSRILGAHEQCENLYAEGRIIEAATSLLETTNAASEHVRSNKLIMDWLADFTKRCISALEIHGDKASRAKKYSKALEAYSTALTLNTSTPDALLIKWARTMLIRGSVNEALGAALEFKVSRFLVYQTICNILEGDNEFTKVIECFRRMQRELAGDTIMEAERIVQWEVEFQKRCIRKLEKLGDVAMDSGDHGVAIEHYSNALLLGPSDLIDVFVKRSKARAASHSLEEALTDVEKVIELDPSSYKGYELKHAALLGMNRHSDAFKTFETMLSKLEQSPDPAVRELRGRYFDATSAIRNVVQQTVQDMPRELIDTATGYLYDKARQAAAFETLPIYDELRSSMITQLDHERIETEVKKFYRYVMFSHRWQSLEPTFQDVGKTSVYELPTSPVFSKLKTFCKLACTLQFAWAWSDTCCVNQLDKGVQQESLVAMFRWYRGSSLTIIHLLGVFSDSQKFGCLWRSIWNTRGWTYQEYLASTVVQFYTEDWKPYLDLKLFNHKESSIIVSEMEGAMNFASKELASLRPGIDRVREKLFLASMRQTTREEDIAYSLFGIFNVALPVVYGEGKQAVGRLLEHILTRSDDVTLLAWTGCSGAQHSYLPVDLTVYNQIIPPHVPSPLDTAKMDAMVKMLRSSLLDLSSAVTLYDRFCDLPPLSMVAGRLRLPGISFPLNELTPISSPGTGSKLRVYHATTAMLGDVEIKTVDDSFETKGLLLIHPWISPLLDHDFQHGARRFDHATCALRLVARLMQPFGALLLEPLGRVQYRRVATDCLIMVRVREGVALSDLIDGIRTVDIQ